jgi:hypothetical protein
LTFRTTLSVYPTSLMILRKSTSVWLFALIVVVFAAIASLFDNFPSPLICVAAASSLLSATAMVPLTLAADHGRRRLPCHPREIWRLNLTMLANVLLLSLALFMLLVLFGGAWWLVRRLTGLQPHSTLDWLLRVVLLAPLGQALVAFAFCGLALSRLPPFKAAANSVLIALNNLPRLILLIVPVEILALLVYGLVRLITGLLQGGCAGAAYPHLVCPSRAALAALWSFSVLGSILLQALCAGIFVTAYALFTGEVQYPWIEEPGAA